MKKTSFIWMFMLLFLYSCVTVNIYFPAKEAQKKASEIVNEIRSNKAPAKTKPQSFNMFFIEEAYAANRAFEVSNAKIKEIKKSMKKRFDIMKPYYKNGYLSEESDGYLKIFKQPHSLKDKITLKKLVNAENADREMLYKEVAAALNIESSQIDKLRKIFAKQWQDTAPKGTYIQTNTRYIRK